MSEYTPVAPEPQTSPVELYQTADRAIALIRLLSIATDHPHREVDPFHLFTLFNLLAEYVDFIATARLAQFEDGDVPFDDEVREAGGAA